MGSNNPWPCACCLRLRAIKHSTSERGGLERSLLALLLQVNGQLDKHERLLGLVLVKDVWASDNGFLTLTMKIKRGVIEAACSGYFQQWQGLRDEVLWHE
jgi:long-chain acyl-CoA synthetase